MEGKKWSDYEIDKVLEKPTIQEHSKWVGIQGWSTNWSSGITETMPKAPSSGYWHSVWWCLWQVACAPFGAERVAEGAFEKVCWQVLVFRKVWKMILWSYMIDQSDQIKFWIKAMQMLKK